MEKATVKDAKPQAKGTTTKAARKQSKDQVNRGNSGCNDRS